MTKKDWVTAALANDTIVAEFLIRMKQPSTTSTSLFPRITWGYRKSRSKEQQNGSPTTPLYWNASTSDGFEDVSSGGTGRSTKIGMHQNPKKEMDKKSKTINHRVHETGFVLPDLNMVPNDEEIYRI